MTPSDAQLARARYIRVILAHHGHNQTDLGNLLGCSQVSAGRKLRGQRRFTDDELLTIADAYGVDPANMLRPPELEGVLGCVRSSEGTLLTCTFKVLPQVSGYVLSLRDDPAKSAVFPRLRAA